MLPVLCVCNTYIYTYIYIFIILLYMHAMYIYIYTWSGGNRWLYGFVHYYANFDALSSMVKWWNHHAGQTKWTRSFKAPFHHLCIPFFGLRKNYFSGDIVMCFLGQSVASSTCYMLLEKVQSLPSSTVHARKRYCACQGMLLPPRPQPPEAKQNH